MRHDGAVNDLRTPLERTEPSTRPTLQRPQAGRWLAGVARGLSDTWSIPAWVLRAIFLILIPIGGLGPLFYAIGWAFIPAEGEPEPLATRWVSRLRDRQAWLGAGLVTLAGIIVISSLNIVDTPLVWAGALLVVGFLLYRGDLDGVSQPRHPAEAGSAGGGLGVAEPELTSPGWEPPEDAFDGGDGSVPPARPALRPPQPPRPPREPSYLGRLTLGAVLLTVGVMVAFDVGGLIEPTSRHYFAAPLLIIGVGLGVGAVVGRSRGLIVLGVLLTPFALTGSLLDVSFDGEFGDIDAAPRTVAELASSYRLEGGNIQLDLRRLELNGEDVAIDASVGGGEIFVSLPPRYQIEIDGRARLGHIDVLGRRSNGFGVDRIDTRPGDGGTIRLDLEAGIGKIGVYDDAGFADGSISYPATLGIRPLTVEELQLPYYLDAGTFEIDLRDLQPPDDGFPLDLDATVERGNITVILPRWFDVKVVAQTGVGAIDVLGERVTGVDLIQEMTVDVAGGAPLNLFLKVIEGSIVVVRP